MARKHPQPEATRQEVLDCVHRRCPACGRRRHYRYDNYRRVRTLTGVVQLRLKIYRCVHQDCHLTGQSYRPEQEGFWALPQHEFGLDVIAAVGQSRYRDHRSIPEIHRQLVGQGLTISLRSVSHLLSRYDELVSLQVNDLERRRSLFERQRHVVLAIDGLQPQVGHEVLWVIRDCISGEILLACPLLSSTQRDLAQLLERVIAQLPVPIVGVVSDGQHSIRNAVAQVLPDVAHGLCHFHYLREAVKPLYEADRHAKKELKKQLRGVRVIEREQEHSSDPMAAAVQQYCSAVRGALSDHGHPPLSPAGVRLHQRLSAIEQSLTRLEQSLAYRQP